MVSTLKYFNFDIYSSIDAPRDENGLCFSTYLKFKNFVLDNLKLGYPIIVENIDWGGHYKIIIGFDSPSSKIEQDMLIFADPYDSYDGNYDGYNYCAAEQFFDMWFDDHCLEKKYKKQPFILVKGKKNK